MVLDNNEIREIHEKEHTFLTVIKSGKGTFTYCKECLEIQYG